MIWNEEKVPIYAAQGLPKGHHADVQQHEKDAPWSWHVSIYVDDDDVALKRCHHQGVITIEMAGESPTFLEARVAAEAAYKKALVAMQELCH